MKFGKKEELKQDMPPVAQELSDDALDDVTGGTVYWHYVRDDAGWRHKYFYAGKVFKFFDSFKKHEVNNWAFTHSVSLVLKHDKNRDQP